MECYSSFESVALPYIIASALSLIGSLIVIAIISYKTLFHSYSFKILLFISINDSLRGIIGGFLGFTGNSKLLCSITAFLLDSISLSNYSWSLCLTFTIYQIIVYEEINYIRHHHKWLIVSYILPLIIESLPLITSSYGFTDGFCSIKRDLIGSIWRFTIYFFPIIMIVTLILLMFIRIYKKIYKIDKSSLADIIFERGLVYVFVILAVEIPFFCLRVAQMIKDSCGLVYTLRAFFFLFLLQGFANSAIFLTNRSVREVLRKRPNIMIKATVQDTLANQSLEISFRSTINI